MAGFITVEPQFNEPLYSEVLGITNDFLYLSPGTRGFSRVWRQFSVLAEGWHIFGRRPKPRGFRAGHHKDLTETGNRARKVSGTQAIFTPVIVKYVEKNLDVTKHRYSEQILPVSSPFVFSRFHCMTLRVLTSIDFRDLSRKNHARVKEEGRCCLHNVISISHRRIFVYPFCLNDIYLSPSDDAFSFSYGFEWFRRNSLLKLRNFTENVLAH